jgi:hypothetical protein
MNKSRLVDAGSIPARGYGCESIPFGLILGKASPTLGERLETLAKRTSEDCLAKRA